MTTTTPAQVPTPGDLQRWSEELARNPASLAFLPLARAFRRQGRLDLALKLCLRGLEHHPEHVEGHALLALLYLESGERAKAADEWAIVLRLKPGNFEALRGMGFRYLEEGDATKARQHLERAALIRPGDTVVQEALRLLKQRQEKAISISGRAQRAADAETSHESSEPSAGDALPWTAAGAAGEGAPEATSAPAEVVAGPLGDANAVDILDLAAPIEPAGSGEGGDTVPIEAPAGDRPAWTRPPPGMIEATPGRPGGGAEEESSGSLNPFESILRQSPSLGVLLLDRNGFVLAGALRGEASGKRDDIAALIGGAIEEARRATTHLELGNWRTLRIEAGQAIVQLTPAADDGLLLVAAKRDTPLGWMMRTAATAKSIARDFLGGVDG